MRTLREILRRNRALVAVLLVLTLALKVSVPAGFMIRTGPMILTIEVCADASGAHTTRQIAIPREDRGGSADRSEADKQAGSCPYSTLGALWTGSAPPALIALALAFLIALGLAPRPFLTPRATAFLRPPLRGPPATA